MDMDNKDKVKTMKPNASHVEINETHLDRWNILKFSELNSINCWHKFIIHDTQGSSRDEVLSAVLDNVYPLDLIPVSFWSDNGNSYFLARNCGPAIQKLYKDKLVVACPRRGRVFKLTILLKFAFIGEFKVVDVQKNVLKVLNKRYDTTTRTINLVRLHEDPALTEFCPLSQPKIMSFVLNLTKSLSPPPENYEMSDNRIKLLNGLEALTSTSAQIQSIDLRNNLLDNFEELNLLKQFKVTDLYLDGNPLCEGVTPEEYVFLVKSKAEHLRILDGIPLKTGQFPIHKKLFLCNLDGADLVNKFLEHYFYIYDSQNRKLIQELYDKRALFSLTSTYHQSSLSSSTTRLYKYTNISRNLKKLVHIPHIIFRHLYRGKQDIADVLCDLPATEHDPFSFEVDLMYYTSRCAIIGISGLFKERPQTLLETEKVYGFRRIFTLEIIDDTGLTNIVNEQFNVYNALSWQVMDCFKISKPVASFANSAVPQNEEECHKAIETLKVITTLNTAWAKKFLEECNFDLRLALTVFVDLYKENRIPDEGFQKQI